MTGLDFTLSRVEAARRLTRNVNLHRLVDFVNGDATAMPVPDAYYDVVISQEAFLHIPDKASVIAQCARVAKPAGTIAFTDVVLRSALGVEDETRMAAEMQAPGIASVERGLRDPIVPDCVRDIAGITDCRRFKCQKWLASAP